MHTSFAIAGFLCYAIPLIALYEYIKNPPTSSNPHLPNRHDLTLRLLSLGLSLGLIYIGTVFIRLSLTS